MQGCSPGNLNLATLSMASPQAESSAKRRRLTHRDMHVAAWTEGSNSEKKKSECEDVEIKRAKIKKEKVAEPIHVVGKDVEWLKVKKEIKNDMEQDMKSSNVDDVDDVPLKEVEVKDEMENDEEDHDKSPQQSEVAVKQEVRRRLTRKVRVAAWTETSSSEKKESECEDVQDDSVRIKKEKVAESFHVVGKDVEWLKVKKEIKNDMEQDMKSSNVDDVDDVPLKEVEVKDEMETDEEDDDDKSPHKSEVAVKQEVRRQLTRKVQVAAWTETSSSEKTGDDRAKIKMETVAEHEASFASPLADADGHEDGRTHAHFSTLKTEDPNPKKCQNL